MTASRAWNVRPRAVLDTVIAALIAVFAVIDVASTSAERLPGERAADVWAYALVVVASASLVWRRRAPLVVLGVVCALLIAFWLRGHSALLSVLGLPAFYAVAAHEQRRDRAWWSLGAALVAVMGAAAVSVLDAADGFAFMKGANIVAFLVGSITAGVVIRNRERLFVDTERRAAAAEADRLAEAERAVVRERSRIAREMHDVVAHGMSVVAVQAAAGREIVHVDPDKAEEVFARIENVGRESLAELRRMLGVLRQSGDVDASLVPQPRIADIAAAVEQSSADGVTTDLAIVGDQRPVAPGVELAVFRIVQEALTNVRKHAGPSATARVTVAFEPHAIRVDVVDDGRGAATALSATGAGHGLIGMRERVEIYGGEFASGPQPGGGYAVRAVLPIVGTGDASAAAPGERRVLGR
jgi:signal transduction histidine kinase